MDRIFIDDIHALFNFRWKLKRLTEIPCTIPRAVLNPIWYFVLSYQRLLSDIAKFKYLERNKDLSESEIDELSKLLQKYLDQFVKYYDEYQALLEKTPRTDEETNTLLCGTLPRLAKLAESRRKHCSKYKNWHSLKTSNIFYYLNNVSNTYSPRDWENLFEYFDYRNDPEKEPVLFEDFRRKQIVESFTNTTPKKFFSFLSWLWYTYRIDLDSFQI